MNRRKKVAFALCAAAVCAVIFSGCGKSESTPDEAVVALTQPSSSQVMTSSVPATKAYEETKPKTEAVIINNEQNAYTPENTESYESVEPQLCTVNVEGKAYEFYVGDTINYVFNLKTPEALEDFQATTNYDSSMLELVDTNLSEMFPVAGSAVICNTDMPNMIKFNAVNINGMDFTEGDVLVSFKFKIIDSGSVAIGTTLEYMDSVKSEPYVTDYKIVGDIEYSEEII